MLADFRRQIDEHRGALDSFEGQLQTLEQIVDALVQCFRRDGRAYILGNGGSAADAQHIAAELVGRFKLDRQALPAIALTTDSSILTAVTNDLGAEQAFVRQVEALVRSGDVVWALSVSGSSPNVLAAVTRARSLGATIVGFTGALGERLRAMCDLCFVAGHGESDRVQEMHQLAYHLICDQVERAVAAPPTSAS